MKAKIAIILLVSIALLGCVQEPVEPEPGPTGGTGTQPPGGEIQPAPEEATGPEYYNTEAEAFAALEEELDSVETASAAELEALLGE